MQGRELLVAFIHFQIIQEVTVIVLREVVVRNNTDTLTRSTTTIVHQYPQQIARSLTSRLIVGIDSLRDSFDDIFFSLAVSSRLQSIGKGSGRDHDRSIARGSSGLFSSRSRIQRIAFSILLLALSCLGSHNDTNVCQRSIVCNNALRQQLSTGIDSHSCLQQRLTVSGKINTVIDSIHIKPILAIKTGPVFLTLIRGNDRCKQRHCTNRTNFRIHNVALIDPLEKSTRDHGMYSSFINRLSRISLYYKRL